MIDEVNRKEDIYREYRGRPIGLLLEYHNLARPYDEYEKAQLLVSMCMDNRKQLKIPNNFAYIIRSGGGNLKFSEFKVSFAIAIGGVRSIALLAHTQCGMVGLRKRKSTFIEGLVENAGWTREMAAAHFEQNASIFEIDDEIEFVFQEAKRLGQRYPKVQIAPLLYRIEDNRLYQIKMEKK
jgi:carbonic anhydrase